MHNFLVILNYFLKNGIVDGYSLLDERLFVEGNGGQIFEVFLEGRHEFVDRTIGILNDSGELLLGLEQVFEFDCFILLV